jgi:hypothetical protein
MEFLMSSSLSVSLGAASAVTQNYAAQAASISVAGQNPAPATTGTQNQTTDLAQFSMDVLKKTVDLQASAGAQLAQLIQGTGVDIQA